MSQRRSTPMYWLAGAALVVGLAAGIVLFVLAAGRPKQAIDHMARAPVGCTTTLSFARSGTYYVWEESSAEDVPAPDGCDPEPVDTGRFNAELSGDGLTVVQLDPADAPMYSVDGRASVRAVTRIDLTAATEVDIAVSGPDVKVTAAVGRDPNAGVSMMRAVGVGSVVAGLGLMTLFLLLARRPAKVPAVAGVPGGYGPMGYQPQPYHPYGQQYPQQPPYQQYPPQTSPQYPYQQQYPQQPAAQYPYQQQYPQQAAAQQNPYQQQYPQQAAQQDPFQRPVPPPDSGQPTDGQQGGQQSEPGRGSTSGWSAPDGSQRRD